MGHSPNQGSQSVTVTQSGANGAALFTTTNPHTFYPDQPVVLSGSSAPGNFSNGTTYYVVFGPNFGSNTFSLSATAGGTPIAYSSAGSSETVGMPTGTYRIIRVEHVVTEQWLTGQGSASAAKAAAKDPTQFNQNQFWKRRRVFQLLGTPNEDTFEYIVSAQDDGT